MGWYDYRLHEGIGKYAIEQGWHLCPDTTREKVIPWGWEGDGILAWLGAGDDLADFVVEAKLPTVDFSFRRPGLSFPRVLLDHAGTARLVAEHFLSRDFEHFTFYSDNDNWSFEERGRAFVAELQAAGHACMWLWWQRSPPIAAAGINGGINGAGSPASCHRPRNRTRSSRPPTNRPWISWKRAKNGPGGSGTGQHRRRRQFPRGSERHAHAHFQRGREHGTLGYRGAALLNDLMNGKPPPKEPIRVPPRA